MHVFAPVDDRLVAQLARFYETYGLEAGENLKLIMPPFIPERATYYRWHTAAFMTPVPEMDLILSRQPDRMVFQWSDGILKRHAEGYGQSPFYRMLRLALGTGRGRIEGDAEVLSRECTADVVWRSNASVEERIVDLNRALHEKLDWPVHLRFRELRRAVIVVSGTYEYHPLPGPRGMQRIDEVQIRGSRERKSINSGGGGSGDIAEFLERVSDYIGRPVVAGPISGAPEKFRWLDCPRPPGLRLPDDELSLVLRHLSEQTGLVFGKEDREVQVLVVQEHLRE